MIIGLVGSQGSGKNTYAERLVERYRELNFIHIDVDKIRHKVLDSDSCKKALYMLFGRGIFEYKAGYSSKDYTCLRIDRKKLGRLTLGCDKRYLVCTNIILPVIEKELDVLLQDRTKNYILNWALLAETSYLSKCDVTVLIKREYSSRKRDVMLRDNISGDYFDLRELRAPKQNESNFDLVLDEESGFEIYPNIEGGASEIN